MRDPPEASQETFISHLIELRSRLLRAIVAVVVIVLVRMRIVTLERLRSARPYVIVGAFVVGAVFTPPDVISQLMLAVPLWLLFELGLVLARFVALPAEKTEASEAANG